VGGKAVGEALITGGAVALIGAGAAGGAAPHAAKTIANPIAPLNPAILKGFSSFIVFSLAQWARIEFLSRPRCVVHTFSIPARLAYPFPSVRILMLFSDFSQGALGNISWHSGIL
jgi:hypothetical protein